MIAIHCTVLDIREGAILVCDHCSDQTVMVHTDLACCFCPGDQLCVEYSGAMTMSLPPQISATHIPRLCCGNL